MGSNLGGIGRNLKKWGGLGSLNWEEFLRNWEEIWEELGGIGRFVVFWKW